MSDVHDVLENRPTDERGVIPYKVLDVYQAAMRLCEAWGESERINATIAYDLTGDNPQHDGIALKCNQLADALRDVCRRAKEGR